uniref:CDC42 small effector protein 2 n=1 Tax=Macaca fascicularis TaxID=9541 RepID=A0A7N9CDT6_MACFA
MSEFWLCFNCCIAEQPQPKRRRRIDRSMIGEPTNFVHTAHVGSGDLFSGMNSLHSEPNAVQGRLRRWNACQCADAARGYEGGIALVLSPKCDGTLSTLS